MYNKFMECQIHRVESPGICYTIQSKAWKRSKNMYSRVLSIQENMGCNCLRSVYNYDSLLVLILPGFLLLPS